MTLNFKKETKTAKMPTKHTRVSAGIDFYSDEDKIIPAKGSAIVSTGISWKPEWDIPGETVAMIIQSRSGYAFKEGIESSNAGVIDLDYFSTPEKQAIIHVKLYNHTSERFKVVRGDKIAQGVLQIVPMVDDVPCLDETRNGEGFGSSDGKE